MRHPHQRAGRSQLWQLVLSRAGERPGYCSWRPETSSPEWTAGT
ncbi:hypothetical protein HRUBRA_01043 [Pseudohaliea rubra DSM 19751]|uniref:Uncharacterized protein n=1 Tax=Pseudohaliea rubra DSM 19751 TaxID=1265313 RepID=A0A095VSC6_9GAMM|nr:hypothetical protein HRUBRA_01043 [Pseudohaliea rubra DSM 19751]